MVSPFSHLSSSSVVLKVLVLIRVVVCQTWSQKYSSSLTDELPLWEAYAHTVQYGSYNLGFGRSVSVTIHELGGCSKGHPCRSSSGLPILFPEGCPKDLCIPRFEGDPWKSSSFDCETEIVESNSTSLIERYGNLTTLSVEWFDFYSKSCMLRYVFDGDRWELRDEGVAIVLKASGFELPAQTVIVSDVDSIKPGSTSMWLDFAQEAVTNFALRGSNLIGVQNKYATDFYQLSELTATPPIVSDVNVTLTRRFLDALNLTMLEESWVMGSMSAVTFDKMRDYPVYRQPEFWYRAAGGTVWSTVNENFDVWVTTMALGRKVSNEFDREVVIMPLKINRWCQCNRISSDTMLVVEPLETPGKCTGRITDGSHYKCSSDGTAYCRLVVSTRWVRTKVGIDGSLHCIKQNVTKAIYERDVGVE